MKIFPSLGRFNNYTGTFSLVVQLQLNHAIKSHQCQKCLGIAKTGGFTVAKSSIFLFFKTLWKPSNNQWKIHCNGQVLGGYSLLQCLGMTQAIATSCWLKNSYKWCVLFARFWPNESVSQRWSDISTFLAEGFQIGWLCQIGCSLYDNNLCMVPTLKQKEGSH